jgi:hypothetical protein
MIIKCIVSLTAIVLACHSPAEVVRSMLGARGAIMSASAWKNPYITDGLIAMWDGEWNAGGGKHDATATEWKELISGVGYSVGSRKFTSLGLSWENTSTLTLTPDSIKGDSFFLGEKTIEFIGSVSATTYYSIGLRGQSPVGCAQNGYGTSPNKCYNTNIEAYDVVAWIMFSTYETNGSFSNVNHRTSLVIQNGKVTPYYNGVPILYQRSITIPSYTTGFSSFIWSGAPDCIAMCIRIYNRALTESEIAQNYAIDKARFNLP